MAVGLNHNAAMSVAGDIYVVGPEQARMPGRRRHCQPLSFQQRCARKLFIAVTACLQLFDDDLHRC